MKLSLLLLLTLAAASIEWIDFVDENGAAVTSAAGLELAATLGANAGGTGGGLKKMSCDYKGGIKAFCVREGTHYIGEVELKCGDGSQDKCGLGKGSGAGGAVSCYSGAIYGMSVVTTSKYIVSITLYGQNKAVVKQFASGRGRAVFAFGGQPDTSKGQLLGVNMRCGWWVDAIQAGFGNLSANCKQSAWKCGNCDKTKGTQGCMRSIVVQPAGDGKKCGAKQETRQCKVDCEMNPWGGWSTCSKTCGGGTRSRKRSVKYEPRNKGASCPAKDESQVCNTQICLKCPPNTVQEGPINADAGGRGLVGHKNYNMAQCNDACIKDNRCLAFHYFAPGGHPGIKNQVCELYGAKDKVNNKYGLNSIVCKPRVNCQQSAWGAWSKCSKTCGGGSQSQSRTVVRVPRNGGTACQAATQSQACNKQPCPVDCKVSSWGKWSSCDKDCGTGKSIRKRTRTVPNAHGGKPCPNLEESKNCNTFACLKCAAGSTQLGPYNGDYPGRGLVGHINGKTIDQCRDECKKNKNCGSYHFFAANGHPGIKTTVCELYPLTVKSITKKYGLNSIVCKVPAVDCKQSGWSSWKACTRVCGTGESIRTRSTTVQPSNGGKACGASVEKKKCNEFACLKCPSGSTQFGPYNGDVGGTGLVGHIYHLNISQCRDRCVKDKRCGSYHFFAKGGHAGWQKTVCELYPTTISSITGKYGTNSIVCKPKVNCAQGGWSSWSACSKKCGGGTRSRSRGTTTWPRNGGTACQKGSETGSCNSQACGCTVELFQHCNYGGYKRVYEKSVSSVGSANDQFSAVKLFNCGTKEVVLFEHNNWGGRSWTVNGAISCFVQHGWNDKVSSVRIADKPFALNQSPEKKDFNSCKLGDQLRIWFWGSTLKGTGNNVKGSVQYRDQAWGNKKTDVFFCCNCSGSVQSPSNCVSLCGTNVRGWKTCSFDKRVANSCTAGKRTCVAYRVGGGCGHRFYGKNFRASLHYRLANLEAENLLFEGEFSELVDSDLMTPAEIEALNVEGQTGYVTYAVFGAVVMMGIGAIVYKRRQSIVAYERIMDDDDI